MNEKVLGKITKVEFGFGGYQDAQMGLSLTFEGKDWGVSKFICGGWNNSINPSEYSKWNEDDRSDNRIKMINEIDKVLTDAKVDHVSQLKNKPVEVEFEGNVIKEWRILTEVL